MMKDVILIMSYCPTPEKKEHLKNLLLQAQKLRDKYDIAVASHTFLDDSFSHLLDFFYFDPKNPVLKDIDLKSNSFFQPSSDFKIWSSFASNGNTHLSILRMLIPVLGMLKTFGYQKVHKLEYDSIIESSEELDENSNLLENFDYVLYKENFPWIVGAFSSFRLDKIISLWEKYDEEFIINHIKKSYPKIPEIITASFVSKERKHIVKDLTKTTLKGIKLNCYASTYTLSAWCFPVYDAKSDMLKFIAWNRLGLPVDIKILVNDKDLKRIHLKDLHTWRMINILKYNEVEKLVVIKNETEVYSYNFKDPSFKNFKAYNFIAYTK